MPVLIRKESYEAYGRRMQLRTVGKSLQPLFTYLEHARRVEMYIGKEMRLFKPECTPLP